MQHGYGGWDLPLPRWLHDSGLVTFVYVYFPYLSMQVASCMSDNPGPGWKPQCSGAHRLCRSGTQPWNSNNILSLLQNVWRRHGEKLMSRATRAKTRNVCTCVGCLVSHGRRQPLCPQALTYSFPREAASRWESSSLVA